MKKCKLETILLSLFSLILAAACGSCSDNNEPNPRRISVNVHGAIVVGCGSTYSAIPGSVTLYDYATSTTTLNAFSRVNDRTLGVSANYAMVDGDYVYIVSSDENTVEVAHKNTLVSVKTVSTETLFGADKGALPRRALAHDGVIYVTTFSGYVCAFDATTYEAKGTYAIGSYPEGMCVDAQGNMYVACSDYGNGIDPSIAVLNLADGSVEQIRDAKIQNPESIFIMDGRVFYLDGGHYESPSPDILDQYDAALYEIKADKSVVKIQDATKAAASDDIIFICNAPFHTPVLTPSYYIFTPSTGEVEMLDISVDSPAFVGVNAQNNLFVGSYTIDPATQYANYSDNGYVRVFDKNRTLYQFECGVGPVAITFNTK